MGLQARLMSQALRKLTSNIKRTNMVVPDLPNMTRSSCDLVDEDDERVGCA